MKLVAKIKISISSRILVVISQGVINYTKLEVLLALRIYIL